MRFVLESGRRVAVQLTSTRAVWPARESTFGGDGERLVVFCHGAPGAGIFDPDPLETRSRGITLLGVDRPGYGRSDPFREGWATVSSAADDVAAVLDSLRAERVGVIGWSAGGRVALALAARRPDLVERVVVAATPAPDDDVPWIAPAQRSALELLRALGPADAHSELAERLAPLVPDDPFSAEALWLLATGAADEAALRVPGVRASLGLMLAAAFAQGARGLAADIAGFCLEPWGFDPGDVQAETLLLYGMHDALAGPRHGRWWRDRLPHGQLEVVPAAGHLLLVPMWARALTHLAPGRPRLRALGTRRNRPQPAGVQPAA